MTSVRPSRSLANGLPQGPRSRSVGRDRDRDRGRARDEDAYAPSSYTSRSAAAAPPVPGLPRQIRPQRSIATISSRTQTNSDFASNTYERSRAREPSLPRGGRNPRDEYASAYAPAGSSDMPRERSRYREDRGSISSHSSASSGSGSSFLDRMKSRAGSGYASSRTSLESEAEMPKGRGGNAVEGRGRGGWLKEREPVQEPPSPDYEPERQPMNAGSSEGYSIWSRVAEAANTLTVNVSLAWATNIATYSGEETPPGQESRLTRAMKAYHLEKARDPSDLPDWLFDEHERRPARADRPTRGNTERERSDTGPVSSSRRGQGLRDIYDRVEASSPPPLAQRAPSRSRFRDADASEERSSKANDRLRAIREAKRTAVQRSATSVSRSDEGDGGRGERGRDFGGERSMRAPMSMPEPAAVRRPVRAGLPARPIPAAQRVY